MNISVIAYLSGDSCSQVRKLVVRRGARQSGDPVNRRRPLLDRCRRKCRYCGISTDICAGGKGRDATDHFRVGAWSSPPPTCLRMGPRPHMLREKLSKFQTLSPLATIRASIHCVPYIITFCVYIEVSLLLCWCGRGQITWPTLSPDCPIKAAAVSLKTATLIFHTFSVTMLFHLVITPNSSLCGKRFFFIIIMCNC